MKNKIVSLDTSFGFSIAIADDDGGILVERALSAVGRESDRLLVPWIVESLAEAGATLKDVSRWTLGTGPGSFAGLRCGIAVAKGAAQASGAILRGVPSAYALATAAPGSAKTVGVIHDGRCGEFLFTRFLRDEAGTLVMEGTTEAIPPAALNEETRRCDSYVTLQKQLLEQAPKDVAERAIVVDSVPATALMAAPEALYPWPTDWNACEKSTEPLYVRQAVFVKPATLRSLSTKD